MSMASEYGAHPPWSPHAGAGPIGAGAWGAPAVDAVFHAVAGELGLERAVGTACPRTYVPTAAVMGGTARDGGAHGREQGSPPRYETYCTYFVTAIRRPALDPAGPPAPARAAARARLPGNRALYLRAACRERRRLVPIPGLAAAAPRAAERRPRHRCPHSRDGTGGTLLPSVFRTVCGGGGGPAKEE